MQLQQEAEEAERVISALRERKRIATDRFADDKMKLSDGAPTDLAEPIKKKRDLVQEQLDKPLNPGACGAAEQLLDELEGMVAKAVETIMQRGVKVATSLRQLAGKTAESLIEEPVPEGHNKLVKAGSQRLLISTEAYEPLEKVQSLIGLVIGGDKGVKLSDVLNLISREKEFTDALEAAGEEARNDLKDRYDQITSSVETYGKQTKKHDELILKLRTPATFADDLLKNWPPEVARPKDLNRQLKPLFDLSGLDDSKQALLDLAATERNAKPWVRADWVGKVMPAAQKFEADIRKSIADMNVGVQDEIVKMLDTAMIKVFEDETKNCDAVKKAINGKESRDQLANKLTGSAKTVYSEVNEAKKQNSKLKIADQEGMADSKFAARKKTLQEQQKALVDEAKDAGVQTTEPDPSVYSGNQYSMLGMQGDSTVYARLDDCPTGQGMGAFMAQYKTALSKGIIPPRSTGSEGVKLEPYGWVVKITLRTAKAHTGLDNTWSPIATVAQVADPPAVYLDFKGWHQRH